MSLTNIYQMLNDVETITYDILRKIENETEDENFEEDPYYKKISFINNGVDMILSEVEFL